MDEAEAKLERILDLCDQGAISPPVALMEMLIETPDETIVAPALAQSAGRSRSARAILALVQANRAGCARVASMLRSGVDSPPADASVEEGVEFCRRLFDWSVRQSEEASVALYSLGNPDLLELATHEIVDVLDKWGSLQCTRDALDLGCGIGRMECALSAKLGTIRAIDVSSEMVAAARRRCRSLDNVIVSTCSGLDLSDFADGSFDLIFAIDTFPYLVQAGMPLVATHFAESARILRADGELVILNFSYDADLATDRDRIAGLSRLHGFHVVVDGETPFALWDGAAFRMRRQGASPSSRMRRSGR